MTSACYYAAERNGAAEDNLAERNSKLTDAQRERLLPQPEPNHFSCTPMYQ